MIWKSYFLKIENLELFDNYWNQVFLIFQVSENFAVYHYIKEEFTPLQQVFQFLIFFHFSSYWNAKVDTCVVLTWQWSF